MSAAKPPPAPAGAGGLGTGKATTAARTALPTGAPPADPTKAAAKAEGRGVSWEPATRDAGRGGEAGEPPPRGPLLGLVPAAASTTSSRNSRVSVSSANPGLRPVASFSSLAKALKATNSIAGGRGSAEEIALRRVASLPRPQRNGLAAAGFSSVLQKWKRLKNAVVGIVRAGKLVAADRTAYLNENTQAITEARRGLLDVALEVSNPRDLDAINYCRQGNASMYSSDMLAKRRSIRAHPQVVAAAQAWWNWLPKSTTRMVTVVEDEGEVFAATISQPIYCAMVVLITLVLLPRFGLPADINYDPTDDWVSDSRGLNYLDFPSFFEAIFELADLWSEGVGGPEYASLLEWTLQGCQELERRRGTFTMLLRKFGYPPPTPPPPKPEPVPQPEPPPSPPPEEEPEPESEEEDEVAPAEAGPAEPPAKKAARSKPPPPQQRKRPEVDTKPDPKPAAPPLPPVRTAPPLPPPPPPPPNPPPQRPIEVLPPPPLTPPAGTTIQTVLVGPLHHESDVVIPHYEWADYSDVESALAAYLRQPLPAMPPRRRSSDGHPLAVTGVARRRPDDPRDTTGDGGGDASDGEGRRRRQGDGERDGTGTGSDGEGQRRQGDGDRDGGEDGDGQQWDAAGGAGGGAWRLGDGVLAQAGGRERASAADGGRGDDESATAAATGGDEYGRSVAAAAVSWQVGGEGGSSGSGSVGGGGGHRLGAGYGGGHVMRGSSVLRPLGSGLQQQGDIAPAWNANQGSGPPSKGGGWRQISPSAPDAVAAIGGEGVRGEGLVGGLGLRSGGSAVFGWELPGGGAGGSLYAEYMDGVIQRHIAQQRLATEGMTVQGTAAGSRARTSDGGGQEGFTPRRAVSGAVPINSNTLGGSSVVPYDVSSYGPLLQGQASAPALWSSGAQAGLGLGLWPRGVTHAGSPGRSRSNGSPKTARSVSPPHNPALAALAAAAAHHLPTINNGYGYDSGGGGSPGRRHGGGAASVGGGLGGGGGGGRSRSPTLMPNLHRPVSWSMGSAGMGSQGAGSVGGLGSGSGGGGGGGSGAATGGSGGGAPTAAAGANGGAGSGGSGGASGGGGNSGGGGVMLPQLSEASRGGTAGGGAGGVGARSGNSDSFGPWETSLPGGAAGPVGWGSESGVAPGARVAPYRPRDLIKASREQVMNMAAALVSQQQQLLPPRPHALAAPGGGGGIGGSIGGGGRLELLRPLNGDAKRAECGGSFQAYVLHSKASGGGGSAAGASATAGAPAAAAPPPAAVAAAAAVPSLTASAAAAAAAQPPTALPVPP